MKFKKLIVYVYCVYICKLQSKDIAEFSNVEYLKKNNSAHIVINKIIVARCLLPNSSETTGPIIEIFCAYRVALRIC